MKSMVGPGPYKRLVDLGTGTARVLTLLSDRVERGSGIDNSHDMLKVARHRLAEAGLDHLTVRQGDLHASPLETGCADLVTLHQVLHYLEDPTEAVIEAARLLEPGGRLLIVDFATHDRDSFRETYNHRRLGFSDAEIAEDMARSGLSLVETRIITTSDRPIVKLWLGQKSEKKIEKRATA
jgi:ArsR family transcriptional regulator